MRDAYEAALTAWRQSGGPRPATRPDGIPTRTDTRWMVPAELAIVRAMQAVENAGGGAALTEAVALLAQARDRVADHVEGVTP